MATPHPLTPKQDYLGRKIHEYAQAAGIAIDDLRWTRAAHGEASELIIRGAGQAQRSRLPAADEFPLPGICRLPPRNLDLRADNNVKGW
jgi:hypothetical protein